MELHAQTLWSDWGAPPVQDRPKPVPLAEEDLHAHLRAVSAMLKPDEVLLTLHSDGGPDAPLRTISFETGLSQDAHAQVAVRAQQTPAGAQGWDLPSGDPDWSTCVLDQQLWHILRLPVWSRRAGSCVTLNLLFKTASLADRSRTLGTLAAVRPMIEGFLRLWQRTRARSRAAAGLRSALDALETGVVLLDRSSRITFTNKAAAGFLTSGEPLRRRGESFTASDLRQAVPLQVALSHAIDSNVDPDPAAADHRRAPILALGSQRSGRSLVLSVVPAEERATEHHDVAAIVFMVDPRLNTAKQLQPVCGLFGLSPTEYRLVCLLTAGKTLQEAAAAMQIKDQTARSYLKQVFLKTDTRRQADLVRLMLSSLLRIEPAIELAALQHAD